jgi:serine/threonine protein kinase
MSFEFEAGSEPVAGYRLVRPKGAPPGVKRWEATDPELRRVVVRLVPLSRPLTDQERFGLDAIRPIRHPKVLPLLEVVEQAGLLVLVSPSFESTFAERLADYRAAGFVGVPRAELICALREAALGLDELNRPRPLPAIFAGEPIRHRDLRPDNVVIEGGVTKLADAGLSLILGGVSANGVLAPSPWKAPEQLFLGTFSDRSDQYALAATFLTLRLGRPPFPESLSLEQQIGAAPNLDGLSLSERPVVERALAKDPAKRWPSPSVFSEAWAAALEGAVSVPVPSAPIISLAQDQFPGPVDAPSSFPVLFGGSAGGGVSVAEAPPATKPAKAKPAKATPQIPVAKPAPPAPKIKEEDAEAFTEELLHPNSIKGWAWSLAMHASLLLILAFWYFSPHLSKTKVINTELAAGSPLGSPLSDQLKGGLGFDEPLSMPTDAERTAPSDLFTPTITSLPASELKLDVPSTGARTKSAGASGATGVNLGNPQAGNGDGFGVARFGQGGENINGVDVKVGDPQFTLIWDSRADLDLHVLEPGGSHIYWENRNGEKGGELDVDDVDGFGPENVYWVQGQGPPGEYKWYVHYYGGLGGIPTPTRWKVRLKHNGTTTVFQGRLNVIGQKSQTYSFKMEPASSSKDATKSARAEK